MVDQSTFIECTSHHTAINKQWNHDIETKRDLARNYLITGGDQEAKSNGGTETEVVSVVESATKPKGQNNVVPSVTATRMVALAMQLEVANEFTLNNQQKSAFMLITGHLNGESRFRIGLSHGFVHTVSSYVCYR